MVKLQNLANVVLAFCYLFTNGMSSHQETIGEGQSQRSHDLEKMVLEQKLVNTMQSTFLSLLSRKTRNLEDKYNTLLRENDQLGDMEAVIHKLATRMERCLDLETAMDKVIRGIDVVVEKVENITTNQKCTQTEWQTYNGTKYYFSNDAVDWQEAKMRCRKLGDKAYLASIPSGEVNSFLIRNGKNGVYWTGGNDIKRERTWVWDYQDERLTFTDWRSGEPNNHGDKGAEDCLMLFTDSSDRRHWNDASCSNLLRYICQNTEN